MTTHYQKIQALGNRMAENLTIMGVPSQFDEGGLTLADKILQIQHFTNGVLLFADKLIEQSSNTIKFTALVLKDGVAQAGKTVHFKGLYSNKITITHDSSNVDLGENGWIITLTGGRVRIGGIATGINIVKRSSGYYIGINSESSTPNLTGDYVYYDGSTKTLYSNNDSLDISNWTGVDSIDFTNLYDTSETWGTVGGVVELPLYATTDSAGVATVTYTCSGAGKIPVVARCGSVVSETYSVFDVLKHYTATTEFYTFSGSTISVSDGVFSVSGSNMPLNPSTSTRYWTTAKTFEFDVDTASTLVVQLGESSNVFNQRLSTLGASNGSHVKIVYDGTTITPFVDGVEKTDYKVSFTHTTKYYFNFYNKGSFKNFVIY